MSEHDTPSQPRATLIALLGGGIGAMLGQWLSFPVPVLTGPAVLVGLLSLTGLRPAIARPLWDGALLTIGLSVGARITDQATEALLRWPLAFAVLALMLAAIMACARLLLGRIFGLRGRAAVLASAPGHMSLILSLAAELRADVLQVSAIQSIRILALTLAVPFAARALGMDMGQVLIGTGQPLAPLQITALAVAGLLAGLALKRLRIPAPMLIGGLAVSTLGHVTAWTEGPMPPWITLPGFFIVGTMIGSRLSGITPARLRRDGLAGLVMTAVAFALAALAALPVARLLDMPLAHVLAAFAPGGLETMVAMGMAMGANPGFLVASHVARLFILLLLLPLFLRRARTDEPDRHPFT